MTNMTVRQRDYLVNSGCRRCCGWRITKRFTRGGGDVLDSG